MRSIPMSFVSLLKDSSQDEFHAITCSTYGLDTLTTIIIIIIIPMLGSKWKVKLDALSSHKRTKKE